MASSTGHYAIDDRRYTVCVRWNVCVDTLYFDYLLDVVAVPAASCTCGAAGSTVAAVDQKPCDRGGCGDGRQDKQRR